MQEQKKKLRKAVVTAAELGGGILRTRSCPTGVLGFERSSLQTTNHILKIERNVLPPKRSERFCGITLKAINLCIEMILKTSEQKLASHRHS